MRQIALALAAILGLVATSTSTSTSTSTPTPTPPSPLDPRFDTDSSLPLHAADVADYTLRARLDPAAHTVHGEGTITWTNASRVAVSELWLHLYLNAFKNDRSAFMRERVGGRGAATPEDWGSVDLRTLSLRSDAGPPSVDLMPSLETRRGGDDDETDAHVALPRDVAPGQRITLDVTFDDKLPAVVERTGYRGTFHMVGQWFPKIARLEPDGTWAHFVLHHLSEFYADFGTYDVTLDVPESFTLGATGPVVESRTEGGRRIERHVQGDVHDFAWTAWDHFRSLRERVGAVDVTVLYPPGFDGVAARDLAAVRFALPYEGARYGRYPYAVLTVVHPQGDAGETGGMEYPTFITSAGPWWTPPGVAVPELVTVHELGHQWFYGLVATNEALWPVLDEGVNEFAEVDALAKWRGPASAVDLFGLSIDDAAVQGVTSAASAHDEPVAQPAYAFSTGTSYGRLVYGRTAATLATLARVYGDAPVARALGRYARRYRFEHPEPADLLAAFAEVLGAEPAEVLRAALFDRGWVDFAVDGAWSERAHGPDAGWDGSVVVRRRGTLVLPVDVDLYFADGSRRREPWNGHGDWLRIPCRGPSALTGAVVDPDHRVLIDERLGNNHAATKGGGGPTRRSLERLTYWIELALQTMPP